MIDFTAIDEQDIITQYECSIGMPCPFCQMSMDRFAYRQLCICCDIECNADCTIINTMPHVRPQIAWFNQQTHIFGIDQETQERTSHIVLAGYIAPQRLNNLKAFI